jgi:hypothetical protein
VNGVELEGLPSSASPEVKARISAYLPILKEERAAYWPNMRQPAYLAAQVEQETCASLKHKKCWNPEAQNINPKNDGEIGWGLGQLTNTNRYNNFEMVTTKYPGLKPWKWEDRFNPRYQLRTMVLMDKSAFDVFKKEEEEDKLAFAFSSYNGGLGNVLKDRKYCAQISACNPAKWWGNVETHSHRSRTKLQGYSVSAYQINREYVHNIMKVRHQKYSSYLE